MKLKLLALFVGLLLTGFLACNKWVDSLPRLDPSGQIDAGPAFTAMVEGRAVYNTSTRRVTTQTGWWPFFDRYTNPD